MLPNIKPAVKNAVFMRSQTLFLMKQRLALSFLLLTSLIITHAILIAHFEALTLGESLWLTLTSITTVGYGDYSAKTPEGRVVTVIFIYFSGIMILTQLVTQYIEFRIAVSHKKHRGQWVWSKMKDHILIIKTPKFDSERYLNRLVNQIKETPSLQRLPIQLVTDEFKDGLPSALRELGVLLYNSEPESISSLQAANAEQAKYIFIMAEDKWAHYSDSLTFDILDKLKQLECKAYIIAEVVNDENRDRFVRVGVQSVIRPVRAYPEIVVRAMAAPGTEQVLEDIFDHKGAHPARVDVEIKSMTWAEIGCAILNEGLGIPLGYIDHDNCVVTNPAPDALVFSKALMVLVHYKHVPSEIQMKNCLDKVR